MDKLKLKQAFAERYKELTDFEEFEICINKFLRKAIRVNTIKTNVD